MAPFRIKSPGIYLDVSAEDYHSDPTPDPSFTQSIAKTILSRSPWHAWFQCQRLNPGFIREEATKFDLGSAAHTILLGRGKTLAVLDVDDWRTKAAREARDAARGEGKVAITREQFDRAGEMAHAARLQLHGRFGLGNLFDDGQAEVMLAWQEDGQWCRTLIDWLSSDMRRVVDLKTTMASAAPTALSAKMASDGWAIQAAMHERGLDTLHPESAGRREYLYLCQEVEPPYALSVSRIGEAPRTIGRRQLAFAFERWRRCLLTNKWDGYEGIQDPEYPGYLETRWLEREVEADERGEFQPETLWAG